MEFCSSLLAYARDLLANPDLKNYLAVGAILFGLAMSWLFVRINTVKGEITVEDDDSQETEDADEASVTIRRDREREDGEVESLELTGWRALVGITVILIFALMLTAVPIGYGVLTLTGLAGSKFLWVCFGLLEIALGVSAAVG